MTRILMVGPSAATRAMLYVEGRTLDGRHVRELVMPNEPTQTVFASITGYGPDISAGYAYDRAPRDVIEVPEFHQPRINRAERRAAARRAR